MISLKLWILSNFKNFILFPRQRQEQADKQLIIGEIQVDWSLSSVPLSMFPCIFEMKWLVRDHNVFSQYDHIHIEREYANIKIIFFYYLQTFLTWSREFLLSARGTSPELEIFKFPPFPIFNNCVAKWNFYLQMEYKLV